MVNMRESFLQPILSTNDCRDQIISALERILESCEQQTSKAIIEYKSYSGGQESLQIKSIYEKIKKVKSKFKQSFVKSPFAINKAPIESIDKIQTMMSKFSAIVSMILYQEISKFNKEESEKIRKEMKIL